MFRHFTFLSVVLNLLLHAEAAEWIKFPSYHRTALPNGVTLLVMEKHAEPLITITMALKSGSVQDPVGREGLAEVTNDLLRKGAGERNAEQIAEELDFIGATLDTSTHYELTRVSAEFLKKDLATGLDLFATLILHPRFPQTEVEKLLKQQVDALKAAKDEPLEVIGQYYNQFLFGTHPYARPPSGDERSLAALTREDIVHFHDQTYVSSNMVFSVCGDFKQEEMEKLLSAHFGGLPARGVAVVGVSKPEPVLAPRLLLVDKPDATQTFFRLGNTGIAMVDPDRVTVDIVNTLFGGRFTSRLNTALRIDSGLTYGAISGFERHKQPGAFFLNSYTQNASTEKALDLALKVLRDLHERSFTQSELASAKAYIKGQFGPTVQTSNQLADLMASFEVFGLDAREVNEYAARLDAVTLADARRVIEKDYPATNLVFTVIGKSSEIAPLMKKYSQRIKACSISDAGFGGN